MQHIWIIILFNICLKKYGLMKLHIKSYLTPVSMVICYY